MRAKMERRAFLAGVAALGGTAWLPSQSKAQSTKTRLILLGTGGGPRPRKANSASAQVIVANDTAYVVDCGDGVARQLAFAGVPLRTLRHIFITHHHSDHNADYGNLLLLAWTAGLRTQVDTWGPPPLEKMTQLFFDMNAYDINTRITDEGRVPLVPAGPCPRADPGRSGYAGRERESDRCPGAPSACRAGVRLSLRRREPLDRHLRGHRAV